MKESIVIKVAESLCNNEFGLNSCREEVCLTCVPLILIVTTQVQIKASLLPLTRS